MNKKELRSAFREKRLAISPTDKMKWDDLMLIHFQALDIPFINYMLSFYPIEQYNEPNRFLIAD